MAVVVRRIELRRCSLSVIDKTWPALTNIRGNILMEEDSKKFPLLIISFFSFFFNRTLLKGNMAVIQVFPG